MFLLFAPICKMVQPMRKELKYYHEKPVLIRQRAKGSPALVLRHMGALQESRRMLRA
jgi:hypothetical protein